jgi:hypothetical protein
MSNWYEPTDEVRATWAAWVAERPPVVRIVAEKFPPWALWRMDHIDQDGKPTGLFQRVFVMSFGETGDPKQPVTLTVAVDGRFNAVAFERNVFGIAPERLTPCDLPGPNDRVGSAGLSLDQVKQMMRADES